MIQKVNNKEKKWSVREDIQYIGKILHEMEPPLAFYYVGLVVIVQARG